MESGPLGSLRMDTHPQAGAGAGGGGGAGERPCFAHLVCTILHGMGLWDIPS